MQCLGYRMHLNAGIESLRPGAADNANEHGQCKAQQPDAPAEEQTAWSAPAGALPVDQDHH